MARMWENYEDKGNEECGGVKTVNTNIASLVTRQQHNFEVQNNKIRNEGNH